MLLYHGTNNKRGLKIIEDKTIKSEIDRIHGDDYPEDLRTTDGYVYLTSSISLAAYYGNKAEVQENDGAGEFYIFRVDDIEENLIERDLDEDRINEKYWGEKDNKNKHFCFKSDIDSSTYNIKYTKLPINYTSDDKTMNEFVEQLIGLNTIEKDGEYEELNDYQKEYVKTMYKKIDVTLKWISI